MTVLSIALVAVMTHHVIATTCCLHGVLVLPSTLGYALLNTLACSCIAGTA